MIGLKSYWLVIGYPGAFLFSRNPLTFIEKLRLRAIFASMFDRMLNRL